MTCFLKAFSDTPCMYRADGLPDRAHLIPAQRLRLAGLGEMEIVWDPRAWVLACRRHHHSLDNGFITLELADYPEDFISYATEHGLIWNPDRRQWRVGFRERAA